MFSTLVSAHGFKNEVYSCLACLFRLMDLRTRYTHVFSAHVLERVVTTRSSRDESSTLYTPTSISFTSGKQHLHFRQDVRLDFR